MYDKIKQKDGTGSAVLKVPAADVDFSAGCGREKVRDIFCPYFAFRGRWNNIQRRDCVIIVHAIEHAKEF